jgi:hypothetical protein
MVSDEKQNVAASEPDVAGPPPRQWRRFLRDVELFDLITAVATTAIAILTGFYVYYARGQFGAMRDQLASLQKSATEASQRFHNEHRPWVVVSASRLSAEPDTKPGTKAPTITLTFKNSGNTPASQVFCQGEMVMSATEPSEFNQESANKVYIGAGGQLINITQGNVTIEDVDGTVRRQSNVAAYNEGKFKLYFHGKVSYEDRGKNQHWTKVCIYHTYGRGLTEFNACSKGNEIDAEPGW